jgi:lactate dehydrogenase-like 2-hydroxyacid dehydrogenase
VGNSGLAFGIDTFGKSAPYKEIYKHFGLTAANIANKSKRMLRNKKMTINVGINGMGRIGRMVIRAIIESQNKNIKIKHINNRSNSEASCTLIKYDSVHGKFNAD